MALIFPLHVLSLVTLIFSSFHVTTKAQIGVCYGQDGHNLPTPSISAQIIRNLSASHVKIYNADPNTLNALKGTNLTISVMIPNELLATVSSGQAQADKWVKNNILPFYPQAMITHILVGNEVLSPYNQTLWPYLVPAVKNIYQALKTLRLHFIIKVGTPLGTDVLQSSVSWPSNATFRADISRSVMKPLVHFLNASRAYFYVDVYPYFEWAASPNNISLDYALLSGRPLKDPYSGLVYTNLLDQMLDSVIFAMKSLGYPNVPLFIAETGWPNAGDYDQIGANVFNAAMYNRNLVKKFTTTPSAGTPARPNVTIPVNIFALYNENGKPGPATERHFGLLYPNGTNVYDIDLSGKRPNSSYLPIPQPINNEPYKGKIWCVVAQGARWAQLRGAVEYVCGLDNQTCAAIQPGGSCHKPKWIVLHASYVFSSYWAQHTSNGETCFFNGLAVQTIKDPSYFSCKIPSLDV